MKFSLGLVCISKNKCRRLPYSPNVKLHWAEKAKWTKEWKDAVGWACYEKMCGNRNKPPMKNALVTITLYANHPYDQDNQYASVKNCVDGLKGLLITNDDPEHCEIVVKTIKVKTRKEEHVEIEVVEK